MTLSDHGIAAHQLLSDIRNARYETVWMHVQRLLDEREVWQRFATGDGTEYEFRSHEFDWFLAELTPDLDTLIRDAMTKAPPELELRYADACGRGEPTTDDQRRPREILAGRYPDAAKRLSVARPTERRAVSFRTPEGRAAHLQGKRLTKERKTEQREFRVRVSGDTELGLAIFDKLVEDPQLADVVFRRLHSRVINERQKRRRSKPDSAP